MDSMDSDRIVRLERQVDFLFRRLGIDPQAALTDDNPLPESFYDALAKNKEILAIKIYREVTGVGLKQAKDAVEAMNPRRR
jgi:ribosomal protein L7/L12